MLHSFLSYLLRESYFLRIPKVHTNYGAAYLSYRRCTVHHGTGLRSVPPVRVQALRALPRAGARCAPAPCVVWVVDLFPSVGRCQVHIYINVRCSSAVLTRRATDSVYWVSESTTGSRLQPGVYLFLSLITFNLQLTTLF